MRWILLGLLLVLLSLVLLGFLLLRLWRKVKVLSRAVAATGDLVDQASAGLAVTHGSDGGRTEPAGHRAPGRHR